MDFPLGLTEILIAFIIVIIGSVVQGSVGFGLGPFSVPLLVMINPIFVPGPLLVSALFLTTIMYFREKHAVKSGELKWAISGRISGTFLGALLLASIPRNSLTLFFGIIVLIAVILLSGPFRLSLTPINLFGAGILSGFMGTTSSIGGPPLALIYHDKEGPRIRGTLSGIFVVGTIISIASLVIIGKFGTRELMISPILIAGVLIGLSISIKTAKFFDRGFTKPAILIISFVSSVVLIIKSLF